LRYSSDPSQLGSKLAPKLVHVISETIVATKRKLLDTEHKARVHSMQEIIDRAGHEVADLYRPVWEEALSEQDMPDYVREHVEKIMSGTHQWQAIAGIAFGASGAPSALSTIISNFLAPGVRFAVAKDPQLAPAPEVMAQMGARGTFPLSEVHDLSHGAGYSDDIVTALVESARSWPDLSTALELYRRRVIGAGDLRLYLERGGMPPHVIPQVVHLADVLLSPADLADMVVRGIKTESEAAGIAGQSGVSAADFHDLTLLTGEPPGLQQLLEGYRRGFIDRAQLEHGIRESRYRNEWIPLLEKLRYSPMSVADAVNAVVQGHMSQAEATSIADQNGLEPGSVNVLFETAGEPLSRTEMSELVNRGEATHAEFVQAMLESRVKNKYIPLAFALRRRIPPAREISSAYSHGAITQAEAIHKIMQYGYSHADAEVIVKSASHVKTASHKANIVSSILAAYEEFLLPRDEALKMIEQMGYDQKEAEFIIEGANFRQSARIVSHAANSVRSHYVSRRISRQTASNELDSLGIPAANRDYLLKMWDVEQSVNVRVLSEAEIVKAVKKSLITPDDGLARLVKLGYSADDATLLLEGA
jgi:hypothetical protein